MKNGLVEGIKKNICRHPGECHICTNTGVIIKLKQTAFIVFITVFLAGCAATKQKIAGLPEGEKWRGIHLLGYDSDEELQELGMLIPEIKKTGLNVIILEIDYNFEFNSHPELRGNDNPVTKKAARNLSKTCRKYNIRLIPEFQCVGHQSWEKETFPLLIKYPHFDLTPGAFPENETIYCREWDVTNPEVYAIVFELLDEIIDAFQSDAFHVGMDEVFLLGSEQSPSTKGKDPGILFAKAINDIYDHLVKKRKVEMLMWGDRLFDGTGYNFGKWESSLNGTAAAVNSIPTDIIICPWHYEKMEAYPSIPIFIKKGFRVLPASWKNVDAAKALIQYSNMQDGPKMLGHLFTTWSKQDILTYPPMTECINLIDKEEN